MLWVHASAIGNLPVVGYQDQELHNLAHHDLYTTKEKVQMIFMEILNNVLVLPIIETNKNLCILFIIKKNNSITAAHEKNKI